jgi:autotransporter-associated beta strand protein
VNSKLNQTAAVMMAAALCVGAPAQADVQWSGGGVTSNWSNPNNWFGFDRPDDDGSDVVSFFGNTPRDTSTVNQSYWIRGIYFGTSSGSSASHTLESSNDAVLTMDTGITSQVSNAQTFNVSIKANSDISFDNGGTSSTYGALTFNGELDTNGKIITMAPSSANITVNGSIIGTGALLVRGAGTVQLNAANSFSSGIQIENGTLQFGAGSSLGATTGFINLRQTFTGNPPTLLRTGTGTVSIPVHLLSGECHLSAPAGVTATYSRALRGSMAANLVKTGAGTVALTSSALLNPGQDAPFGDTTVSQGTLHLAANYALSGRKVTVNSGATLSTAANTSHVFGQLNGAGNLSLGTATTAYIGNSAAVSTNGSGTFTGTISGTDVVVRKEATGTLSLQGDNTFSGTTLVMAGILSVDNTAANTSATGTSTINVQPGGILTGDGAATGAVTVNAGAFISPSNIATPGSGIGSLATGPLSLDSAATTFIGFNATLSDLLSVSGDAYLSGRLDLSGSGATFAQFNQRRILSTTGARSGVFTRVDGVSISPTESLAVTYGNDGVFLTVARPGDTNLDGSVNFNDLLTLAQNYGRSGFQIWSLADFTGDAATNFNDLLILAQNYNQNFAADWALAQSMVPEPTALLAIAATVPALLRRRR